MPSCRCALTSWIVCGNRIAVSPRLWLMYRQRNGWVETYIDKLLFLILVVCSSSLVLEYNIVVPSSLHVEVGFRIQQGVTKCNVLFSLGLFGGCLLSFLRNCVRYWRSCLVKDPLLTSCSRFSARSRLIFSSSRWSSAVSSSSSSLGDMSVSPVPQSSPTLVPRGRPWSSIGSPHSIDPFPLGYSRPISTSIAGRLQDPAEQKPN